jgi:hypothetical protein
MKQSVEIDGVNYVMKTYLFGKDLEINDKALTVQFDPATKQVIPITRMGMLRMLHVLYSLTSWDFKGTDDDGNPLKDGKVLDINEDNVKKLPKNHGDKLADVAMEINGMSEKKEKN